MWVVTSESQGSESKRTAPRVQSGAAASRSPDKKVVMVSELYFVTWSVNYICNLVSELYFVQS